ncbi:hypothetical protein MMC11_001220 [Xylographa trunciseda]|nr:hypothetical protein [Xylographa trunciseda]
MHFCSGSPVLQPKSVKRLTDTMEEAIDPANEEAQIQSVALGEPTTDDDGYLYLCTESTRQVVASKALKRVSPVFRAVLQQSDLFKGQQLTEMPTLQLENDEPRAVELLCDLLHSSSKSHNVPDSMEALLSFADLCNKYRCEKAMESQVAYWLSIAVSASPNISILTEYLGIAYSFKLELQFADISWRIVAMLDESEAENLQLPELVPHKVKGMSG